MALACALLGLGPYKRLAIAGWELDLEVEFTAIELLTAGEPVRM